MIAKLSGRVDGAGDGWVVVDVGGVGYLVFCSGRTLARLEPGTATSLHVETQVREDAIQLFGFLDAVEREWFRLLTTVQGVGAKVALAILTVLAPADLALAIAAGDRAALSRAAGVGPRLAARIASELKDKAAPIGQGGMATALRVPGMADDTRDAVAALVNLGFAPGEALTAIAAAAGRLGEAPGVEALIRDGLARLAPRGEVS
jgi:holliday junction DNA helicase RuvA